MHFTVPLTALLATTATALTIPAAHPRLPQPPTPGNNQNEHIAISSYSLRKINSTIQSLSFHISTSHHQNVTCATGAIPHLPSPFMPCTGGETPNATYEFSVAAAPGGSWNGTAAKDPNQYEVTILHGKEYKGKWGRAVVPTYCHTGGLGASDFVCEQVPTEKKFGITLWG